MFPKLSLLVWILLLVWLLLVLLLLFITLMIINGVDNLGFDNILKGICSNHFCLLSCGIILFIKIKCFYRFNFLLFLKVNGTSLGNVTNWRP